MEKPLYIKKKEFLGQINEPKTSFKRLSCSISETEYETIEKQIDRAIRLGKRTKSKSAIIRMALKALDKLSDTEYIELYEKV